MEQAANTIWHFPVMIFASFLLFFFVIWIVLGKQELVQKFKIIFGLSILFFVLGMLF